VAFSFFFFFGKSFCILRVQQVENLSRKPPGRKYA